MNRLLTITLNGLAFLVLGLAGVAAANVITIGQLTVYGPVALSGIQNAIVFGASSAQFVSGFFLGSWGSGYPPAANYYGVTPDLFDILSLAQSAVGPIVSGDALQGLYVSALATPSQLDTIILLPLDNPIFAVPLPSTASLMICGFAALAFMARVFEARMGRTG